MTAYPVVTVEAALTTDPLAATPTWLTLLSADGITSRLLQCPTMNRQIGQAGTMTLILDNSDAALNPWNRYSQYYGNLLTRNQSIFDTGTTGWQNAGNATLARVATPTSIGFGSLRMTSGGGGGQMTGETLTGTSAVLVQGATTIVGAASFLAAGTGRTCRLKILFFDSGGTSISQVSGSNISDVNSSWTGATVTAAVPANAVYANLQAQVDGTAAAEVHYVDGAQMATHANWFSVGGLGGLLQPMVKVRVSAQWNLLTANQASLETDTTGWSGSNATPTRNTGRPLVGSAALLMVVGAAGNAVAETVPIKTPVIAGHTYSAMAYVSPNGPTHTFQVSIRWYTSADVFISQSDSGVGTEAAEPAYTFGGVTATAPATAAKAAVKVTVFGMAAGEGWWIDGVALFPAPGIQDWSPGGPYYLFTGYVEEWGVEWEDINLGDTAVQVVDANKVMTLVKPAKTDYRDASLADSPSGLYGLNETGRSSAVNGLITAADSSGNARDAVYKGSPASYENNGALPAELGTATDFGVRTGWVEIPISTVASGTGNFSVEAWVFPRSFAQTAPIDKIWHVIDVGSQHVELNIQTDGKPRLWVSDGTNGGYINSTTALDLFRWNHVVAVKSGTTGPTNWKMYLNGGDVSGTTSLDGTGNVSVTANSVLLAGRTESSVSKGALDGLMDEVAVYPSALSAARVAAHFNAGYGLVANALAGSRLGKFLDLVNFPAADRTLDAGQFQMQPVSEPLYDTPLFGLIQLLVESEGWPAAWFFDGKGYAVFQDRAHSTPSSSATFSDASSTLYYDPGPGPVRSDRVGLWTRVVLQADNGKPQTAEDATAAARFIGRTLTRTGLKNLNDSDVATMAATELARWKTPRDRLERLVIHPIDEPGISTMWPHVLGLELNDVVTVERTDNPGGGSPFSGNFRISGIGHNFDGQDWFTTWQLEPT